MIFAEAWPEIETFLLEVARADSPDTIARPSIGVSEDVVATLENEIGRPLPAEFKFYLGKGCFGRYAPFYQDFELLGAEMLSLERSELWSNFPEAEGVISSPLVIGQDTSIAFVTDLDDVICPVFRIDEVYDWIPKLMAHSLADFLYLLSCREMLIEKSLAVSEKNNWKEDKARNQADSDMFKNKLMLLAPDCLSQWNLWR